MVAQNPPQGRIHVPTVCQASKQGEMRRDAFTVYIDTRPFQLISYYLFAEILSGLL